MCVCVCGVRVCVIVHAYSECLGGVYVYGVRLCVCLLYVWDICMQCIVWYVYDLYVYVCAWCVSIMHMVCLCVHKFVCVSTYVVVRAQLWLLNLIFHS